ncbi:serine/threonine-protein kinase [Limnoglobus roseus]|uniref:non-specific serine/threonine protein kinase n=1 Tax=Limnoglobus roseus TaxID=2598579 RepID=A0A5C1AKZ5_9BACT|nr:serine/threonine-protein kinase [Limnoglobus roseus]QEL19610.1 serine/threonine protein kinase [Limnoglobus roseus]
MSDTTRVYDLLADWDELRQQGKTATAEQLCPDDPVLQDELRVRIRRQQQIRGFIDVPEPTAAGMPAVPAVDGYDVLGVVGNGGMGIVYRANHRRLGRVVALKMILAGDTADRQQLARFQDEARAVAALQHPNIVQVYEAGEAAGRPFLVLEFVSGGSLADHLGGTPIDPRRAAELSRTLAQAVQHAHDRGIVHRDLKPGNVLLDPDGTPKVTDFGLAKRLGDDSARTRTGTAIGSPSYMPPEQAAGDRTVGPAADVYSLGAILYELLTGRPPFRGQTVLETIRLVSEHPPAPPSALQPGVPKDLEVVCLKCLEKQPDDRYPSAAALAADLDRYLAGEPIHARPPSVLGQMARNLKRGNFHPNFSRYSAWLLALAPFPLIIHTSAYFAWRHEADFPVWMTGVSLAVIIALQVALHVMARPTFLLVPPAQRRHFVIVWSSECVGAVVAWIVVRAVVPADRLDLMYLVYPLWAGHLGHTYLAFASEAGGLYVQGSLFYVLALLLVAVLPWTPLILGGMMFVNMSASGLMLRRGMGVGATRPPEQ